MKRAKSAKRAGSVATRPVDAAAETSVIVPVLAPRNPYQALARQRKAGAHDVDARKRRRLENDELRRRVAEE